MSLDRSDRMPFRIMQFALLLAVCAGGAMVWHDRHDLAGHEQRLTKLDELEAAARQQREAATQLLRLAQEKLTAAEQYKAARDARKKSPPAPGESPASPDSSPSTQSLKTPETR